MAITGPTNFRADKTAAENGEAIIFTWTAATGEFDGYILEYHGMNGASVSGFGIIRDSRADSYYHIFSCGEFYGHGSYVRYGLRAYRGEDPGNPIEEGPISYINIYYSGSEENLPSVSTVSGKLEQFQNSAGEQIFPRTIIEGIFRQSDSKSLAALLTESGGVGLSMAGKTVEMIAGEKITAKDGAEIFNDYQERKEIEFTTGVEKVGNIATGIYSHAEGYGATAAGTVSHAEGGQNIASGLCSHAEGGFTTASGDYSHAGGLYTNASQQCQTAIGHANVISASADDMFIIGKGGVSNNVAISRANCFRAAYTGVYASGSYNASGADYAEMFEWADGNPDNEDRAGRFVTLDGVKIRLAGPGDDYILGIVSGNPSVVGDVHDDQWQGMYLYDIFGRPLWEDVEVPEQKDNTGRVIFPARTERRQKLNPNYDSTQKYTPRSQRPEWDAVGMLGKLVAVDDGTCQVNGWCTVGEGGIAVVSEKRTKYRVMERLDENYIRVMIL